MGWNNFKINTHFIVVGMKSRQKFSRISVTHLWVRWTQFRMNRGVICLLLADCFQFCFLFFVIVNGNLRWLSIHGVGSWRRRGGLRCCWWCFNNGLLIERRSVNYFWLHIGHISNDNWPIVDRHDCARSRREHGTIFLNTIANRKRHLADWTVEVRLLWCWR